MRFIEYDRFHTALYNERQAPVSTTDRASSIQKFVQCSQFQ